MLLSGNTSIGGVEIRPHERTVLVHGQDVPLTPGEFGIVMMLAEHPGWVFSSAQLSDGAEEGDHSPESVSVLVSRLRQKFAAAGAPEIIETVRGFGYRIRSPEAGESEEKATADSRREVRDALWQLQGAVIEVEHSGTQQQRRAAAEALERARHLIYSSLAE